MISCPVRSAIRRKTIVTNFEVLYRENLQAVRSAKMANQPTPQEVEVRVIDSGHQLFEEREASSRGQMTRDPAIWGKRWKVRSERTSERVRKK